MLECLSVIRELNTDYAGNKTAVDLLPELNM